MREYPISIVIEHIANMAEKRKEVDGVDSTDV